MKNLILLYTPFNQLVVKALMDQGLINENSLVVDHNIKPCSEFVNYLHLSNKLKKVSIHL